MEPKGKAEKLTTLDEAVALVPDGSRVALGGFPMFSKPMAFVRALVAAGRTELVVVGTSNGVDLDLLAGAGALAEVETSYVGLEQFGLAPNFRRKVEQGELTVWDFSEGVSFDRFRASQDGLTFVACSHLLGTDMLRRNPSLKEFDCPLTGRRLVAVPPAAASVAVIHAPAADPYGNVLYPHRRFFPQGLDLTMACSVDTLIVTAERIVSNDFVRRHPELTQIPGFRTTCVVHAPWGAHPTAMLGFYEIDERHMEEAYVPAAKSDASFDEYLEAYVRPGVPQEYLDRVGMHRLVEDQEWGYA